MFVSSWHVHFVSSRMAHAVCALVFRTNSGMSILGSIIVESVNMLSIKNQQEWWHHRNSISISKSILEEVSQAHHHNHAFSDRKDNSIALTLIEFQSGAVRFLFSPWCALASIRHSIRPSL